MRFPRLIIYTDRIRNNAETISSLAKKKNISITGVTKATCGNIHVAKAMVEGGVHSLADSRLENLQNLRNYFGQNLPLMLLRLPMLSKVDEVVAITDVSLNSELQVIKALGLAAAQQRKTHGIILMVDLGDLREGIWPDMLLDTVKAIRDYPGVDLQGLGTNLTCYGGIIPDEDNLGQLLHMVEETENLLGKELQWISGGNSSSLHLLLQERMPEGINELRIGETILIGNDTGLNKPFPNTRDDGFILQAELIEEKIKPSVPIGNVGRDAFGRIPKKPEDRGKRRRGILAIGEQDMQAGGLKPMDKGVDILGSSSDHLLLDITDSEKKLCIGDYVSFTVDYGNLLRAMTSSYVEKVVLS